MRRQWWLISQSNSERVSKTENPVLSGTTLVQSSALWIREKSDIPVLTGGSFRQADTLRIARFLVLLVWNFKHEHTEIERSNDKTDTHRYSYSYHDPGFTAPSGLVFRFPVVLSPGPNMRERDETKLLIQAMHAIREKSASPRENPNGTRLPQLLIPLPWAMLYWVGLSICTMSWKLLPGGGFWRLAAAVPQWDFCSRASV